LVHLQKRRNDSLKLCRIAFVDFNLMHIDTRFVLRFQSFDRIFDSADISKFGEELL